MNLILKNTMNCEQFFDSVFLNCYKSKKIFKQKSNCLKKEKQCLCYVKI